MAQAVDNVLPMPARPSGIRTSVKKSMTEEYIAHNGYSWGQNRILGSTKDDIEIEVNSETYDRMENDATITKCKRIIITNVLSDELQMAPGATEANVGPEEYKVYIELKEFCERVIEGLESPVREQLEQQLGNSIKYGHGIAETQWEYREDGSSTKPKEEKSTKAPKGGLSAFWAKMGGFFMAEKQEEDDTPDPGIKRPQLRNKKIRLMPKSIKVKPRGAARFVVDEYMNVLGLVPKFRTPSVSADQIIDRDKFMVLTVQKHDEDPRGRSMYRPAFNWYNIKTQLPAEMLRFVLEEVVPKAVGTLAEDAPPYEYDRDIDGNIQFEADGTTPKMLTAVESMKKSMSGFRSGSGIILPHGATFEPFKKGLTGSTDGLLFNQVLKMVNNEMENSILLQTLAQSEGEHQARSASEQVAQLLYNLVFWIRWLIAKMIETDLLKVAIEKNFGTWALRYMPFVSLGDFVRRDWASDLEVIARAYFWGFIDDTQREELMAWLNLPTPGPSRQELGLEASAQADVNGDPVVPNKNRPDKQAGTKNRNSGNGTEKKNVKAESENTGFSPLNLLGYHGRRISSTTRNLFSGRRTR